MKHIKKRWVRMVIAVVFGLALAYSGVGVTHVTRPCSPATVPKGESIIHCESSEKVFVHPRELFSNKQDKLTHFSETFAAASLASFALLSVFSWSQKKNM